MKKKTPEGPGYLDRESLVEISQSIRKPLELAFGPACVEERIVFGAHMPGYGARSIPESVVMRWISFMKERGIMRVCSLLAPSQLEYFMVNLLKVYRGEFGDTSVLDAPVEDYHLCRTEMLRKILLFLKESDSEGEPVVVHCAGGRGRTGLVHAAWLVHGRGFPIEKALEAVKKMGRNPFQAVEQGTTKEEELYTLLRLCTGNG